MRNCLGFKYKTQFPSSEVNLKFNYIAIGYHLLHCYVYFPMLIFVVIHGCCSWVELFNCSHPLEACIVHGSCIDCRKYASRLEPAQLESSKQLWYFISSQSEWSKLISQLTTNAGKVVEIREHSLNISSFILRSSTENSPKTKNKSTIWADYTSH